MLDGKTVILGVSGSIAAYKAASLASSLKKLHADVQVIMTKNAAEFISPLTFESLTGNRCLTDTFDREFEYSVEHVALAERADIFMLAPATADVIAKIAGGIADDMLTTTFLTCDCPKYVSPAMNTRMLLNPATQENLRTLSKRGINVIEPASGHLACGEDGPGKMPEPETLISYIIREIGYPKDLSGEKILVSAGPTREALDPVRYITNHSSGKMGYAVARAAMNRGADVTLVSGPVNIDAPVGVKLISVVTAKEMFDAVTSEYADKDIIIMAAAVADYRPSAISDKKIKKNDDSFSLELERTDDILEYLGMNKKEGQFLCGFSMETDDLIENSVSKLQKKNLDMIAANDLSTPGAGFETDTNKLTLITSDDVEQLDMMSKDEAAHLLLTKIREMI